LVSVFLNADADGEALKTSLKTLQVGRCIVACEAVKLAQEAVNYSINYAKGFI